MENFADRLRALPAACFCGEGVVIRPIEDEDDLWYAVAECRLPPEQAELVNPAGFSIGRAWLDPSSNLPCVIAAADGTRVGFITLRRWGTSEANAQDAFNWSYYIDTRYQGRGLGRAAAALAIRILKAAYPDTPIKLSTEACNGRAQRLYRSLGFTLSDERDGDDLVFVL